MIEIFVIGMMFLTIGGVFLLNGSFDLDSFNGKMVFIMAWTFVIIGMCAIGSSLIRSKKNDKV